MATTLNKKEGPWYRVSRGLSIVTFGVLITTLVLGLAPNINTKLVQLGDSFWPGYAAELRTPPKAPECDLQRLKQQSSQCVDAPAAKLGDPFAAEDPVEEDPFADTLSAAGTNCTALDSAVKRCETRYLVYDETISNITPAVERFSRYEKGVAALAKFPGWRELLSLLLMVSLIQTTLRRKHISLSTPQSLGDIRVSQGTQALAHLLAATSAWFDIAVTGASAAESQNVLLPWIWLLGFSVLAAINLYNLIALPNTKHLSTTKIPAAKSLLTIPLYTWMLLIGAVWFNFIEGHFSGQAIFIHKFVQHPSIYAGIGLYIWSGMLLSQTRLAARCFDIITPWGLPPALMAWVVIVAAALPTAYSGASGIFVIAAGAVIFDRLIDAGAPKRIALAATAMSGSLGVVLRPCLVVVLIATLNKGVDTSTLFSGGLKVFALTAVLSLVGFLLVAKRPLKVSPTGNALAKSGRAIGTLLPYLVLGACALWLYQRPLGTSLTENTAPLILPGLLIVLLIYDKWTQDAPTFGEVNTSLQVATTEATDHTGALLALMMASVGLGGVVERTAVMELVPSMAGSPILAMSLLVVVMVLVGMTMDALGAVVLVSVTVAGVAYDAGIDPLHFWMMVLVAFELGYLTPPVALNHLLAKAVIGKRALLVRDEDSLSFSAHYQHILLPIAVMGTALLIVAFGPFLL